MNVTELTHITIIFAISLPSFSPITARFFEVWFDGAKGSNAKKFEYDWQRYYDLIRKLQPKANIAICGPDIRWVGNAGGKSRKSEYSVVPCALREADRIMALSQQDEKIRLHLFKNITKWTRI